MREVLPSFVGGLTAVVARAEDARIVKAILGKNSEQPDAWERPSDETILGLSRTETLVARAVSRTRSLGDRRPARARTCAVRKILERRDSNLHTNFDLKLLEAALKAECLTKKQRERLHPQTEAWLQTLRGKRRVLTRDQKRGITLRFGLAEEKPLTYKEIGETTKISALRSRKLCQTALFDLADRYKGLTKSALGI